MGDSIEATARDDMPLDEYFQLVHQVSVKLRDESFHFSERPLAVGATDFVMDTLVAAENLEEAMRHAARAYNLMHGGHYNRVERHRDRIAYVIDDRDFPYVFDSNSDSNVVHAVMEGVLIFLHALLSLAAGADISDSLRAVRTRRATRQPSNGLLAFWTVPVRYGSPTYVLEYDLAMASLPVRTDATNTTVRAVDIYENAISMIAAREQSLRPNGFAARVARAIAGGALDQPEVAQKLGLSTATLRRRLADNDLSFRAIRVRVLEEAACALLAERRTVADVADALGFADARSFSRAFKGWKGVTPAAFVTMLGRGPPSRDQFF